MDGPVWVGRGGLITTLETAEAFFAERFPEMVLRLPLIAQWPPGLRFTLGGPGGWLDEDPERVRRIHRRAAAIFDACFPADSTGFVVVQCDTPVGYELPASVTAADIRAGGQIPVDLSQPIVGVAPEGLLEVGPYVPASVVRDAGIRSGRDLYGPPEQLPSPDGSALEDSIPFSEFILEIPPGLVDRQLVLATANREMPAEPKVSSQLYFVDTRNALILNIGDDRWLDVIAATSVPLRPLAARFVDWLESARLPA